MTWIFNPAHLPPASINALTSAGFISFTAKIKSGTQPGYTINNTATVKIDNGNTVTTNTTSNFIAFPTAIQQVPGSNITIKVFPNPFNDIVSFDVNGIDGAYDFEMIDVTGRVVKNKSLQGSGHFTLGRGQLANGVYFYRFIINNQVAGNGKLVIN